jgi:plastocyanin
MKGLMWLALLVIVVLVGGWWIASMYSPAGEEAQNTDTEMQQEEAANNNAAGGSQNAAGNGSVERVADGSHWIYTVYFNSDTFSPTSLNIKAGDSVKWVNRDNLTMKISAVRKGTNENPITDPKSQPKGGTFSMSFTAPGVWVISNQNGTGASGGNSTIYVE